MNDKITTVFKIFLGMFIMTSFAHVGCHKTASQTEVKASESKPVESKPTKVKSVTAEIKPVTEPAVAEKSVETKSEVKEIKEVK